MRGPVGFPALLRIYYIHTYTLYTSIVLLCLMNGTTSAYLVVVRIVGQKVTRDENEDCDTCPCR